MLFFYLVALPVVACAALWALLFLPSRTTGKSHSHRPPSHPRRTSLLLQHKRQGYRLRWRYRHDVYWGWSCYSAAVLWASCSDFAASLS